MGVKFSLEYVSIIDRFSAALSKLSDVWEFLDLDRSEWEKISDGKKKEYLRTLADDIFFALSEQPNMEVGSGKVVYDSGRHKILVMQDNYCELIDLI